jgi:putative colanic acid biosynthesis acetyltransferase WcaF
LGGIGIWRRCRYHSPRHVAFQWVKDDRGTVPVTGFCTRVNSEPPDPAGVFQTLDRTAPYPYSRSEYARRYLWLLVQATLFRLPIPRAYGWRRSLLRAFGAQMGQAAAVHATTRILHPWLFAMGDWSNLSSGVTVYNLGPVKVGNHTVISQDAYLCAGTHDYSQPTLPLLRPPITIGNGVWIAAGAFVGPGVTVGDDSVVGARAVVVKDVPAGVVVAGNPARIVKPRDVGPPLPPGEGRGEGTP